jgi:hypothetical protein
MNQDTNSDKITNNIDIIDNSNSNSDSNPRKRYRKNDIILVDSEHKISYDLTYERNIFRHNYCECMCFFCDKEIKQYIGDGYDYNKDFEPTNLLNHLMKDHSDEFITIKKVDVNKKTEIISIVLLKKVIL